LLLLYYSLRADIIKVAIVLGATGGFGRGVVRAIKAKNMRVVAVARDAARLETIAREENVEFSVGDATSEAVVGTLLQVYKPDLVVCAIGVAPPLRPLRLHTWETFSMTWDVDVKATFVLLRNALLLPMKPGSHIVIFSSGAATRGSELSGGYAGAKRTQMFIANYASAESERGKLGLRIQCLLPMLNASGLGLPAMAAYAERAGLPLDEFKKRFGAPITPASIGQAVVDLHFNGNEWNLPAYEVSGAGMKTLSV